MTQLTLDAVASYFKLFHQLKWFLFFDHDKLSECAKTAQKKWKWKWLGTVRFESSGPNLAPYCSGRHSCHSGAGANNMPGLSLLLASSTAAVSELSACTVMTACLSPRIGLSVLGLALANPTEQHVFQPVVGPTHLSPPFCCTICTVPLVCTGCSPLESTVRRSVASPSSPLKRFTMWCLGAWRTAWNTVLGTSDGRFSRPPMAPGLPQPQLELNA